MGRLKIDGRRRERIKKQGNYASHSSGTSKSIALKRALNGIDRSHSIITMYNFTELMVRISEMW